MKVLEVKNLSTYFFTNPEKPVKAVDGISFDVNRGETLGILGQSGSGKSVTAKSILKLVKGPGKIVSGQVLFEGKDLMKISGEEIRKIRGRKISFIPQNPIKSFSPTVSIGKQLEEMVKFHRPEIKKEKRKEFILELLKKVEIADPSLKLKNISEEWSGGMAQRAMIVKMALIPKPEIIIADEPTTALDATVGAEILDLLTSMVKERNISLILIGHDLGIMSEYADRILVMQEGKIVEDNSKENLFKNPSHPYTRELLEAAKMDFPCQKKFRSRGSLLRIEGLKVYFPIFGGKLRKRKVGDVKAVDGIDLEIKKGEILGLGGESGCGKSTLAKVILRIIPKTRGKIFFEGQDLDKISPRMDKEIRRKIQIVFQDPDSSLDKKMTAEDLIGEGIDIHQLCGKYYTFRRLKLSFLLKLLKITPLRFFSVYNRLKMDQENLSKGVIQRRDRIIEIAEKVKMPVDRLFDYSKEISGGGEKQRVSIARALAVSSQLLVLDEPISSLDKKIQKQILELLLELKRQQGLTYLFISHDLNVISKISDRIAIMYLGRIIEIGRTEEIKANPLHYYTQALFSAQTILDPDLAKKRKKIILKGEIPSAENIPSGCRFHTRCPLREDICKETEPVLKKVSASHWVACHKI